jgi:hypothetical protein
MEYLPSIEIVMNLAARESSFAEFPQIETEHLFIALLKFAELNADVGKNQLGDPGLESLLEAEIMGVKGIVEALGADEAQLRRIIRQRMGKGGVPFRGGTIHRSQTAKEAFSRARDIAEKQGDNSMSAAHLLLAIVQRPPLFLDELFPENPFRTPANPLPEAEGTHEGGLPKLLKPFPAQSQRDMRALAELMAQLRKKLREKIPWQMPAALSLVRGLFNAELPSAVTENQGRPKAAFIFLGPPAVGKYSMAKHAADALGRPIRRFVASDYSPDIVAIHTGSIAEKEDPRPGTLTEFVQNSPDGFVYFENIENAPLGLIEILTTILDTGCLDDPALGRTVDFTSTVIILGTNAGRGMYENIRGAEIFFDHESLFEESVIESMAIPRDGSPRLHEAILSRCFAMRLVLFTTVGGSDGVKMMAEAMRSSASSLLAPYGMQVEVRAEVPALVLLREGLPSEPRRIASKGESFVRTEISNFLSLMKPEHLRTIMTRDSTVIFELEDELFLPEDVACIVAPRERPRILAVVEYKVGESWTGRMKNAIWFVAPDLARVREILSTQSIDMALIDPFIIQEPCGDDSLPIVRDQTLAAFDHVPTSAASVALGKELLREIRTSQPKIPCFFVSMRGDARKKALDKEFVDECIRIGAVRGHVESGFDSDSSDSSLNRFATRLKELAIEAVLEQKLEASRSLNWGIAFETAPIISKEDNTIRMRIRNLRLSEKPRPRIGTREDIAVHSSSQHIRGFDVLGETSPSPSASVSRADALLAPGGHFKRDSQGQDLPKSLSKSSGQEYAFPGWEDGTLAPVPDKPSDNDRKSPEPEIIECSNAEPVPSPLSEGGVGHKTVDSGYTSGIADLQGEAVQEHFAQDSAKPTQQPESPVTKEQPKKEQSPSMFFKWEE